MLHQANRKTIKKSGSIHGKGLHSGKKSKIIFHPAEENTNILLYYSSGDSSSTIPANLDHCLKTSRAVSLGNEDVVFQTIEHLMYAIFVCGITDMLIEVKGGKEIPILDGSARPFIDLFDSLGFNKYDGKVDCLVVEQPIKIEDESCSLLALPSDHFKISYTIDYPHRFLKSRSVELDYDPQFFKEKISRARTFGFLEEADSMKKNGFIQGASLKNTLVFSEAGTVNPPRFEEEAIYHKILDLIGDISLLRKSIKAHIIGYKSGHFLNIAFANRLREADDIRVSSLSEKKDSIDAS